MHRVEGQVSFFPERKGAVIIGFGEEGEGGGDEREKLGRGGVRRGKGGEGRVARRRRSHGWERRGRLKGDIVPWSRRRCARKGWLSLED